MLTHKLIQNTTYSLSHLGEQVNTVIVDSDPWLNM